MDTSPRRPGASRPRRLQPCAGPNPTSTTWPGTSRWSPSHRCAFLLLPSRGRTSRGPLVESLVVAAPRRASRPAQAPMPRPASWKPSWPPSTVVYSEAAAVAPYAGGAAARQPMSRPRRHFEARATRQRVDHRTSSTSRRFRRRYRPQRASGARLLACAARSNRRATSMQGYLCIRLFIAL